MPSLLEVPQHPQPALNLVIFLGHHRSPPGPIGLPNGMSRKIVHIYTSELGSSSSQHAMVIQTNKYNTSIRLELFIFYEEKNLLAVGQ